MDDARIRELAEEVMRDIRSPAAADPAARGSLEARVAALESEVARLRQSRALPMVASAEPPSVHVHVGHEHPSQGRIGPAGGSDHCVLEPDKPCVGSGQCRTFGY
jgi:hypothetical protein